MRIRQCLSVSAAALALLLPGAAEAGTVTRTSSAITFNAQQATAADERVDVGVENGFGFVTSERGVTSSDCTETDPNRVDCDLSPAFIVNLLGFNDSLAAQLLTNGATLEAHGGAGDDRLSGGSAADRLFGDAGGDNLAGLGGNDLLEGGPGENYYDDGSGDDTITGGPNSDTLTAGPGRDTFAGGDGSDTVDYSARTGPLTITLDGRADDGEAGEFDNVGADVESATGGSGNDRIVAGPSSSYLYGGSGNDSITGGPGEQRVESNEGDDTVDTRDGAFDSVDCGPGNDTVLADLGDSTANCEIAPDRDGDGTPNEADCAPEDPAVHPGAGEVFGNPVDEDCKNGAGYLIVGAGIKYKVASKTRGARIRLSVLQVSEVQAGDRIEIRCRGKGCPFRSKARTGAAGKPVVKLIALLKKRFLRVGTVIEIRILRENQHGKVHILRVLKGHDVQLTKRCLIVGETTPRVCPVVS
jgi:hypothetical protein